MVFIKEICVSLPLFLPSVCTVCILSVSPMVPLVSCVCVCVRVRVRVRTCTSNSRKEAIIMSRGLLGYLSLKVCKRTGHGQFYLL